MIDKRMKQIYYANMNQKRTTLQSGKVDFRTKKIRDI